jgi:putative acetyltransferase
MHIRNEAAADWGAIRAIHIAAFAHHPFSRQTEHLIVEELRKDGALTISLVAEEDGNVIGHIAFSMATIGGKECNWYLMGPVAVMPDLQRKGTGSLLVREGLARLRAIGAKGCVLVGDPAFYTRLGFAKSANISMEGVPADVILSLAFEGGEPRGELGHHRAFLAGLDGHE